MESAQPPAGFDLGKQRMAMAATIAIAFPAAIVLWLATDRLAPPLTGMDTALARLVFALKCSCLAILFCFVTGVEAVAHERLRSPAIDPLIGYETRRLRVNLRYLQNTLEQLIVFVPGLLGLAYYASDEAAMRRVVDATVVWIATRIAFWIGYHRSSASRGFGVAGMVVGMGMLLYVCARFGFEIAGRPGAIAMLSLFAAVEAFLVWATRPMERGSGAGNQP